MAIDELLFEEIQTAAVRQLGSSAAQQQRHCLYRAAAAVLRIYFWDKAYTTIGYFQKNDCEAVRRMTGGLLVNHKDDLSYGFCAAAEEWPYIYNQQDTYKHIHTAIKKALADVNIESGFADVKQNTDKNNLCVQTLYSDDLIYGGRKIAGSCMRRRGKKILVQGSLHLNLEKERKEKFSRCFAGNMAKLLNMDLNDKNISSDEISKASSLAKTKYLTKEWNYKF